jgi:hypothetical protein
MNSTEIFALDTLLEAMPTDALKQARERLDSTLTEKAIEIADMVGKDESFGLESLIGERELLKIFISRIDVRLNILFNQTEFEYAA